jgi:hypothetical protein
MSTTAASAPGTRWSEAGLAVRGGLAVAAASVAVALLQSVWGTLLDGFGLHGWRIGVVAVLLGLLDAMILVGVLLLLVWGVGRLTRAPHDPGARTFIVVVVALLAAALVELAACVAELGATGQISERLVSDPAHWVGPDMLGALSLSNLAVYAVAAGGTVRVLGWSAIRAAVLVLVLAALATGSAVVA